MLKNQGKTGLPILARFSEVVDAAKVLLEKRRRVSYRALAREFGLDPAALADLTEELIEAQQVAADENGKVIVWVGPALEGERRQLSVMFCDLVGSTALSEKLDPEDLHELLSAYQSLCRKIISRYDGYVAQYLGDGILAYFGYPRAHEDDAVRAVQAGFDIIEAVSRLDADPKVRVRIGVHTGPVVIGAIGEGERARQLALGETPNIAARVQGAADAQSLAISRDTFSLVQGIFECEDLGTKSFKGISQPLRLYRVTGKGEAKSRFDVSVQRGLTPLVGRESELELLLQRWRGAKAGRGQIVMLSGEAGIGKSRLTQALHERTADEAASRLIFRCSPFYQNSALYPVVDQLNRFVQAGADGTPESRLRALERFLESSAMRDDETIALFAALLNIPLPESSTMSALGPRERKAKTLQALVTWLQRQAIRRPVVMVFEDLHWADPSTLEVLDLAIGQNAAARILILLVFRPKFVPPWPENDRALTVGLTRLSDADVVSVATRIAGRPLPPDVVELLIRKTDGVPLYVEEMTRDLLESDLLDETQGGFKLTRSPLDLAVPFSLNDSLASRLDRLGPVRRLAQVGSVLGRDFNFALIHAVANTEAVELADGLDQLCDADILFQRDGAEDAIYSFRHALLQDAAYNSLLKKQRQRIHSQVAGIIEADRPEIASLHPELVAHHYTEAEMFAQAIPYWQRAGEQAVQTSANKEAIGHFSKALDILEELPRGAARDRQELALHLALGVPLTVTTSWAAPEVRQAYERALELCDALGESKQLFPVMYGVWSSYQVRADYRAAKPVSEQLLTLAERADDTGFLLQAHRASGIIGVHMGDFAAALEHCELGAAIYDPDRHHSHVGTYWMDPGVGCKCYGAWSLWCLGYPDRALERVSEALDLAHARGHAFSLAYARHFGAVIHQSRREAEATRQHAEALVELANEQGFPVFQAWGSLLLGCALAEQGRGLDGSALIHNAQLATWSTGAEVAKSASLAVLAGVYEKAGEIDRGMAAVAQGIEFVAQSEEHFYESELYRVRGEMTCRTGKGDDGEGADARARIDFEHAIQIARSQQAKSWELRAVTSLARLLARRGESPKAREMLNETYEWFTEGFATKDLGDAKALLEDLS